MPYLYVYKNLIILIQVVGYVLTRSYRQKPRVIISPLHALIDTKLTSEKLILQKQTSHKTKICNVSDSSPSECYQQSNSKYHAVTDITEIYSAIP